MSILIFACLSFDSFAEFVFISHPSSVCHARAPFYSFTMPVSPRAHMRLRSPFRTLLHVVLPVAVLELSYPAACAITTFARPIK